MKRPVNLTRGSAPWKGGRRFAPRPLLSGRPRFDRAGNGNATAAQFLLSVIVPDNDSPIIVEPARGDSVRVVPLTQ